MRPAARALAAVARNPYLRRAEAAFALAVSAEYGSWVAILVYAYRAGGATETGLVATAQLVPAGLLVPLAGVAADRLGGARAFAFSCGLQALALGAAAAALGSGLPPAAVYPFAVAAAVAVATLRPTHAVVTPALARSPLELGAVNVVAGWATASVALAAPALVGVILSVAGPGTAFGCAAGVDVLATLLALGLPRTAPEPADRSLRAFAAELSGGLRAVVEVRAVRLVIAFVGALAVVVGAVDVLAVVLALGPLGLGPGGPGYLTAAFGAGGLVGAIASLSLIGRRRFVPHLVAAALAAGLALAVLGGWTGVAAAFLLFGLAGAGGIVFDVVSHTLLQRTAPTHVLSRVAALAESLLNLGLAAGSLAVPLLVALGGVRAALIGIGGMLPLLVLLRLRGLLAIDSEATVPVVETALLRGMPMFALLPAPALAGLAAALTPLEVPAGTSVVVEGEEGDRFYAIADGRFEVVAAGRAAATLGRGDGFGEIALLRDVPRTATITALTEGRLYALERDAFLLALTGHAPTGSALDAIADARLRELEQLQPTSGAR